MVAVLSFAPTVERLKDAGFRTVDGVLEFAGLTAAPRAVPALFVVPERESAAPNRMSGVIDQKVTEIFSVIIVEEVRRADGKASDQLKRDVDAVVAALLGWRHPEASGPTEYAGGRLTSLDGGHIVWAASFSASRHLRKESQ